MIKDSILPQFRRCPAHIRLAYSACGSGEVVERYVYDPYLCVHIATDDPFLRLLPWETAVLPEGGHPSSTESSQLGSLRVHSNGGAGILLGNNWSIKHCAAGQNGLTGIQAQDGCAMVHCVANNNGQHGISVNKGNSITNCTAYSNLGNGIYADDGTTISDSAAYLNGTTGFLVDAATLTNCVAYKNTSQGIAADYSVLRGCIARDNDSSGFWIDDCSVVSCKARGNASNGIAMRGYSTVIDCVCAENDSDGIDVANGWGRIERNVLVSNGAYGITTTNYNGLIVQNFALGNANGNYEPGLSGIVGPISSSISTHPWANYENP